MDDSHGRTRADPDAYLDRLGLDRRDVEPADRAALRTLQRAHVTTVPFETLSITGDPHGERAGEGVVLELPHLYDKIVERERGGYCFELNGLFGWLLGELGFDADRVAARVDDRPPANHHAFVVHLDGSHDDGGDRSYVVDVGLGGPRLRRPVPLDGSVVEDGTGARWRVVEREDPGIDYAVQRQGPGESELSDRYVFDATPRPLTYFGATCDYLQTSPDSPFTGDPIVSIATGEGRVRLTTDALVRYEGGDEREDPVAPDEWHDVLAREFGLRFP